MAGLSESKPACHTLIPGLLGSFFVFAGISGYQNVGAATIIAVLVASQLIGGLRRYLPGSHGVPLGVDRPNLWRNFIYGWCLARLTPHFNCEDGTAFG